jgi:hypothetical protein
MGRWRHKAPKTRFWGKFFYRAKVVLEYFGTTWSIFHREQAQAIAVACRRIEASPMALRALHCFGNARPAQPYYIIYIIYIVHTHTHTHTNSLISA